MTNITSFRWGCVVCVVMSSAKAAKYIYSVCIPWLCPSPPFANPDAKHTLSSEWGQVIDSIASDTLIDFDMVGVAKLAWWKKSGKWLSS